MDKYNKSVLDNYNIVSVYMPADMTYHFKPLDLTVNGQAKPFLKEKFGKNLMVELKSIKSKLNFN